MSAAALNPNRFATPAEVEALRRRHALAALGALSPEARQAALEAAELGDALGEIVALAWLLAAGDDMRGAGMSAPNLTQRLKSLMRNARRQGGSQGPKSCASLDAAAAISISQALTASDSSPELEARRDLLAAARALYSTQWLAGAARCTTRHAQQIMSQRLVSMARCGDFWGFPDLPDLRERALRPSRSRGPQQTKVAARCTGHRPEQLCLFEGEAK